MAVPDTGRTPLSRALVPDVVRRGAGRGRVPVPDCRRPAPDSRVKRRT